MDTRVSKLANVLVNYSLKLKKNEFFVIVGSELSTDLIKEVFREAIRIGAIPYVIVNIDDLDYIFLKEASTEQLTAVPEVNYFLAEKIDAMLEIYGKYNTKNLTNIDPQRLKIVANARERLTKRYLERINSGEMRLCITQFPTHSAAQEAEMSLLEYEDFVYDAGYLNMKDPVAKWKEVSKNQEKIKNFLDSKDEIKIKGPECDLIFKTNKREWLNAFGTQNFPDGELFISPIENSMEGEIKFSFPSTYAGKEMNGIKFIFKKGEIIEVDAGKGKDFLLQILNIDEGAKRVGEFGIGTNYNIRKLTNNALFDEKVGGTFHIGIGASVPGSGGENISSVHWDIVHDAGLAEMYANDKLFYKNGRFESSIYI